MRGRAGLLALGLLLSNAACAHAPSVVVTDRLQAIRAVRDVVAGVAHHIDGRDWAALRALFADEVETDYTSLFGGEVQRQRADELIGGWKKLLTPVVTQHHLGPIVVTQDDGRATAHCHVRGHHFKAGLRDGDTWMVAGHYVFELTRGPQGWKIERMKLETLYQAGNRKLLQQAAR